MWSKNIVKISIAVIIIILMPMGCSRGKKLEDPLSGDIPQSREFGGGVSSRILGIKQIRMNLNSGDIIELPNRSEEWDPLQIPSDLITIKAHLVTVDEDYDAKHEAINGVLQESLSERQTKVRFWVSVINETCEDPPTEDGIFITCPRVIFVPKNIEDGGSGLPVRMLDAEGRLNIDLTSYGIDALPGPYYYRRLLRAGSNEWEIPPNEGDDGDCNDYIDDTNLSSLEYCEMVFPVNALSVTDFVDWFIVIDGMTGDESWQEENRWPPGDPYSISDLTVKRSTPINAFYDDLWDLNIIRLDDNFDLRLILNMRDSGFHDQNHTSYLIKIFVNGVFKGDLDYSGVESATQVAVGANDVNINSVLGVDAYSPSGMYEFEVRVRRVGDSSYYLSQEYEIPFVNPNIDEAQDWFQAGYYIIGAVHASEPGSSAVTQMSLMNSFTREVHVCTNDGLPMENIYNLSLQKAAGGDIDHTRIAYEFSGHIGGQPSTRVGVWEWTPDDETAYGTDSDTLFLSNIHSYFPVGSPSPYSPCISPEGDMIAYSAGGAPPSTTGCRYSYKEFWRFYDGFTSTYDCNLNQETIMGTPYNGQANLYQFDWDFIYDVPQQEWVHRCGLDNTYTGCPFTANGGQDGTWLMNASIAGPNSYEDLPGAGEVDDVYTVVFSYGGDCSQEYTPLQFYFFQILGSPGDQSVNRLYECKFAPNDYWGSAPDFEVKTEEAGIGGHIGDEKHFLNPVISSDARSVVFIGSKDGVSRVYKIDINHGLFTNVNFISNDPAWPFSTQVGFMPMIGANQNWASINTCYWEFGDTEYEFIELPVDVIAYQEGQGTGTDIWIALQLGWNDFFRYNLTGPFGIKFKTYSGKGDISTREAVYDGNYCFRAGLVFTSHEYKAGDLFIADHVVEGPYIPWGNHRTKIRRMTNHGGVVEAQISDFIWVR